MLTAVAQRWRDRASSFRPTGEVIATRDYDVAPIAETEPAKAFVAAHHYEGSFPAARERVGLYRHGALVGVAVFSVPVNALSLRPLPASDGNVELGRFVLLDDVAANGETWFLARAFDYLRREGYAGVTSFSDPVPRTSAAGVVTFSGHIGTIYQAFNGTYLGRARAGSLRLLPDGRVLHNRAIAKVRKLDKGWRYVVADLVRAGAREPRNSEDVRDWVEVILPTITRRLTHGGNHKYVWPLDRVTRKALARVVEPKPYPKFDRAV